MNGKTFVVTIITTEKCGEDGNIEHCYHEFEMKGIHEVDVFNQIFYDSKDFIHYKGPRGRHYYIMKGQIIEISIKEKE